MAKKRAEADSRHAPSVELQTFFFNIGRASTGDVSPRPPSSPLFIGKEKNIYKRTRRRRREKKSPL